MSTQQILELLRAEWNSSVVRVDSLEQQIRLQFDCSDRTIDEQLRTRIDLCGKREEAILNRNRLHKVLIAAHRLAELNDEDGV